MTTPYELLDMGFYLFPVSIYFDEKKNKWEKQPLVPWTKESTNDRKRIEWWSTWKNRNAWGIDCGKSNIAVIDVDSGKVSGAAERLYEHEFEHGELPRTLTVRTRTGGSHQIYRGAFRNSASAKLGNGLDTRGPGGYIVAAGSPGYEIVDASPIAEIPQWVCDLVGRPLERKEREPINIEYDTPYAIERATYFLREEADPAIEGMGGNHHTLMVARHLHDLGVSEGMAAELMLDLWNESCCPIWSPDELYTIVKNAYHYANEKPGRLNCQLVFDEVNIEDEPTAPKKSRFIDATDLISREITINYLVHGFIETPTTGLIFGDPGTKKSFIAIDLACCVATGTPWMEQLTTQGPVFYFAGEGKAGIPRRIKAWLKHHGQTLQPGMLHVSDSRIEITPQSARSLVSEIKQLTAEYGSPALIIIDTLARHLPSDSDENSAKDFGVFVNAIDGMRDAFNCVALIIHHSGKQNKDSSRGTSAIKGALDFEFKTDGLRLECKKQKEGEEPQPLMYHLENVEIGEGVTSAVVVSDGFGERIDRTKKLKARSLMAFEVLKMEVSTNGGRAVLRDAWRDSFYKQLGTDISKSGKANALKSAEQELLDVGLIVNELGSYRLVEDDTPF